MPVRTFQIEGGARVLLFTCEVCGRPATLGISCSVLAAIRTGDVSKTGKWYCFEHREYAVAPEPKPIQCVQTDEPSLF